MENINVGVVNLIISEKFKSVFFNQNALNESKLKINEFFDVIKNSPILQTEFKVLSNIENKRVNNDVSATRYVDNNIKLFEVYTFEEVKKEREKLTPFVENSDVLNEEKHKNRVKLYNSITNIINESLKCYEDVDVDQLHESFDYVLEYIKKPIEERTGIINETIDLKNIDEAIIKIAVDKFNEKYKNLSEDDKKFLNTLVKSDESEKKNLFEEEKKEVILILEEQDDKNLVDKKHKALEKIKGMEYNKDTINDNIIKLYELKKGLL